MNNATIDSSQTYRKYKKLTSLFFLIGIIASLCLVFFFIMLFKLRDSSITPKIFKAEQIGSTDSSILLAWSSSDAAKEFIVKYRSTDSIEYKQFRTDKPFAAIHGLQPFKRYKAIVAPVDGSVEYKACTVLCNTSPFCHVSDVAVDEVTGSSAHITWNSEGIDAGFTVVAYALDLNGKRHVTSQQVHVSPGTAHECTVDHLLSELNYTVCVMPDTKYATVGKSSFTTLKYSKEYNQLKVIRFATCSAESEDSMHVRAINRLEPQKDYKTSIIINGEASPEDKIELTLYITDTDGNIVSDFIKKDVYTNPENKLYYN